MCAEEPPAQRDASGRIILNPNEGGFADQTYWPNIEANERRKREGWKQLLHPDKWTRAEEDVISGALQRLAKSVAPKNPNEDDDDNSNDEDPVDSDGYTVLGEENRGRQAAPSHYVDGWPADLICGEGKYSGPHYGCFLPAVYGRKRDQCICEFYFCGYISKHDCFCSARVLGAVLDNGLGRINAYCSSSPFHQKSGGPSRKASCTQLLTYYSYIFNTWYTNQYTWFDMIRCSFSLAGPKLVKK